MQQALEQLKAEALEAIAAAMDMTSLEAVRVKYFSRSGALPLIMEQMKSVPPVDRPVIGRLANEVKTAMQSAFDSKKETLELSASRDSVDATLPGREIPVGSLHPILEVRDRAIAIWRRLGFVLAEGPDLEWEYYNFDALNTPPEHPARNEQDTFYLPETHPAARGEGRLGRRLLRTQTSPVQIRVMENQQPPIRIIAPGRCYRRDEIDATHGLSFHQMEALVVDRGVTLADLKGTMELFFRELLGADLVFRFRPHFFPFTEPSFEVDCSRPGSTVKGKQWLEICGCGMVHPKVLSSAGIDPEEYSGFALGFGIERIAMMLYGIPDLRLLGENDVRMLRQLSVV